MGIRQLFGIVCTVAFFLISCASPGVIRQAKEPAPLPPLPVPTVQLPKAEDPGPLPAPNEPEIQPPAPAPPAFLVHAEPPDATWKAGMNPRTKSPVFVKEQFDAVIMLAGHESDEDTTATSVLESFGEILKNNGMKIGRISSDPKTNSAGADMTGTMNGVPTSGKVHIRIFKEISHAVLILGFWPTKNNARVAPDYLKVVKSLKLIQNPGNGNSV